WIPQARITWQNRNDAARLAGISSSTQWLAVVSGLFWIAFGVLSDSFWVMAPCLISVPLGLATLVVVRRGRRLPPPTISVPIIDSSEFVDTFVDTTENLAESTQTSSIPIVMTGESADVGVPIIVTSESDEVGVPSVSVAAGSYTSTGSIPIRF
ncbi:MAG: hypothetical protein ABWX59_09705, partial [Microbacteriaceae bacterium]